LTEALTMFIRDPLVAAPGERFVYSTYSYVLAGVVLERAAGATYAEYMRDNVFRPAGALAIETDDTYRIIPNRSRGYFRNAQGEIRNCALADTSMKIPGGGLTGTAEDLVKVALAVNSGKLVSDRSKQEMWRRTRLSGGEDIAYGLGWILERLDGRFATGHNGGQQGATTALRLLPEERVAAAVMMNLEAAEINPLIEDIVRILLK
jgi:CubicO group peptidase (beta-lactamase class C family)